MKLARWNAGPVYMPAVFGALMAVMVAHGQEPGVPPDQETQTQPSEPASEIGETTSEVQPGTGSEAAADAGTEGADDAGTQEAYPEVRAGHMVFKVLGVKQEAVGSGPRATITLTIPVRITDVMGKPDYVDSQTLRLDVDGAELLPENSINTSLFARQAIVAEPVFSIPADARQVELVVGRESDGRERIPLRLSEPSGAATQE